MMRKAVMYGGGNIGRGFIGALLSRSGYHVTFVDVAEPIVTELNERKSYPIRILDGQNKEDLIIKNVSAVHGNNREEVAAEIASCDIMATAVGARVLKFIVPNIVSGLRKRWSEHGRPLNIIICENLNDANRVVERMIKEQLTVSEVERFDRTVGLVEASIGRMVPVQTDEMKDGEPLRICTESYGFLPVDKAAFKGTIPDIKGMVPFEPFDFFVKRKLFIHNMAHATTAYLGDLIGKEYIYEAIDNPDILLIVQNAMMESAQALVKRYGTDMDWMLGHINDLLRRFANITLKDTCARVGGDPARKLSPGDRLAGSMKLAEEEGICPAYIAVGAAAGLRRYLKEAGLARNEEEALKALENVSQIPKDSALAQLVLEYFRMISTSCSIAALRREAQRRKALSLMSII